MDKRLGVIAGNLLDQPLVNSVSSDTHPPSSPIENSDLNSVRRLTRSKNFCIFYFLSHNISHFYMNNFPWVYRNLAKFYSYIAAVFLKFIFKLLMVIILSYALTVDFYINNFNVPL